MQAKTTLKLHLTPVRKGNIKAKIMKKLLGCMWGKWNTFILVGVQVGVAPVDTSVTVSLKN